MDKNYPKAMDDSAFPEWKCASQELGLAFFGQYLLLTHLLQDMQIRNLLSKLVYEGQLYYLL
jgi:hypothetical protein